MQDAPDRSASVMAAAQDDGVAHIGNKDEGPVSSLTALKIESNSMHDNSSRSKSPQDRSPQEDNARVSRTTSTADSGLYYESERADQKPNAVFASRGIKPIKPMSSLDDSDSIRTDPVMSSQAGASTSMSKAEASANNTSQLASAESSGGHVGQKRETKGSIHIDGKKRYPCPFAGCDKTFSTSGHSSRHSRIHTGEKPYHCTYPGCRAQFSRYDNSLQHYRTHIISSKDGKKPKGKAASTALSENGEGSQNNKTGRKSKSSLKASEQRPLPDQETTVMAYPHQTSGITSDAVSNPDKLHLKPSQSFVQPTRNSLPNYPSGSSSRPEIDLIIDKERTISLPLVPLKELRESQHGLSSHLRSQDGVKRMRLSSKSSSFHSSVDGVKEEPQFAIPNSYDAYENGPTSYNDRPSMIRETYSWHGMGSGVSVMDHLRTGAGSTLPNRSPGEAKPTLSVYSPYPSPTRAAFDKPMLAGSHTFDLGSRPIPYPLAGTELDRMLPTTQPELSGSGKLSPGLPSSFAPSSNLPETARRRNFSMRRSGSMPSLLNLDEPRLESSNSLLKYSLSSRKSIPKLSTPRTFSDQAEHMPSRLVGSGITSLATERDSETSMTTHQRELHPPLPATRR